MTKDEIFAKIKPLIVAQVGPTGNPRDPFEEKVTLEANLADDLNVDSLDRVELVMDYENEFDMAIEDDDPIFACVTVSDQVDKLYNLISPST